MCKLKFMRLSIFGAAMLLAAMTESCSSTVPPLLRSVTAAGGWYGGCPRNAQDPAGPLALSPELDSRLRKLFPPGSSSNQLKSLLIKDGFVLGSPCAADPSISTASYEQKKYILEQLQANVYWKADSQNRIVWTEGFVDFDGL